MDRSQILDAVRAWPVDDRLELVFDLWDQIGPPVSPDPAFAAELARRVAEYEAAPDRVFTWDEVMAHVRRDRT